VPRQDPSTLFRTSILQKKARGPLSVPRSVLARMADRLTCFIKIYQKVSIVLALEIGSCYIAPATHTKPLL